MSDQDDTKAEPLPPHETTSSPVELSVATPRYFGVTPTTFLFGVLSATLAVAIVLAILGHWLAALVLAAVVLLEVALFLSVARRKPDTATARVSAGTIVRARERVAWLVESASVRSETGRRLTAVRHELFELAERREKHLRSLGVAVYEGDDEAAKRLQQQLKTLDDETRRKEGQINAIAESAHERLQEGRLRVQPTEIRSPEDPEYQKSR